MKQMDDPGTKQEERFVEMGERIDKCLEGEDTFASVGCLLFTAVLGARDIDMSLDVLMAMLADVWQVTEKRGLQ